MFWVSVIRWGRFVIPHNILSVSNTQYDRFSHHLSYFVFDGRAYTSRFHDFRDDLFITNTFPFAVPLLSAQQSSLSSMLGFEL